MRVSSNPNGRKPAGGHDVHRGSFPLDAERRASQLRVLRSWLGAHGSWDATAKDLGLHRNSVRRQINGVAELLGIDLGQAQARAELWIALQYVDDAAQAEPA